MAKVNCLLEECIYNIETICTKDEITLYDEHPCCGGCDDGWEFANEEDEDDERSD